MERLLPNLGESHFLSGFIEGLRDNIRLRLRMWRPTSLSNTFGIAKLQKKLLETHKKPKIPSRSSVTRLLLILGYITVITVPANCNRTFSNFSKLTIAAHLSTDCNPQPIKFTAVLILLPKSLPPMHNNIFCILLELDVVGELSFL